MTTSVPPTTPTSSLESPRVPTPSQREAIEANAHALLVLAGPGAGKTFCLIERIRHLIEKLHFDPARICAFTFTNKAAGEIAHRLEAQLGDAAAKIKRGTIHAFCAELLRELGTSVLLEPGFGIADEEYQLSVLRRIEGARRWHRGTLNRFSAHRFRGDPLMHDDAMLFEMYERFLAKRKLVDFDTLVLRAADLLERDREGAEVRGRWDVILVDEFQDLNPVQYRVVRALAKDHRHVFGVGDDEQSIYSWAGADPQVFKDFANDFSITKPVYLEDNKRCPRVVADLARKLINVNTPIFANRIAPKAERDTVFPVTTWGFETDDGEVDWIINDVRRDRAEHRHRWGEVALLYRTHDIGNRLEAAFLNGGIPCRLAQGRALAEDPVVAHVIAALRVIANPKDDVYRDAFFQIVLPRALFDKARSQAENARHDLRRQLNYMASRLPRAHEDGRQIRRALTDWRNLEALGKAHATIGSLVQELLSRRVGKTRSVLDDRHDEITDPVILADVIALADRLRDARERGVEVTIAMMGGIEIAIKGMLSAIAVQTAPRGEPAREGGIHIAADDVPSVGIALGVFKAAQLLEMRDHAEAFSDFTAIDLETTGKNTNECEIVEIAAVRVRGGEIAETFATLVKPKVAIEPGASDTHGIRAADVAMAPAFDEVWPKFHAFCGDDVVVAHNGYDFDFRILTRMAKVLGKKFDLVTYDTLPLARDLFPTSKKLEHLAPMFGIPTGTSHRALDDTVALAKVVLALDGVKLERARKTALVNLLDNLGIALALSNYDSLCEEAKLFRGICRPYALSRYSSCLDAYEREQGEDISVPTVDELIDKLGGTELMLKIRADKSAEERYPQAMLRLKRILDEIPAGALAQQMTTFLERVVLSKYDGLEPDGHRVNLLTLHSTKGLEFSRVYIVGVEDSQMPGGSPTKGPTPAEIEEARRLLYVGMTRTKDRLVMTRVVSRTGKETRGHQFLDEMGIEPVTPSVVS